MYHLNNEGKILPCKARVRACPYGADNHSKNKEELYKKVAREYINVSPSRSALEEVANYGQLTSLKVMSDEIMQSESPVELIVSTLSDVIEKIESDEGGSYETQYTPRQRQYLNEYGPMLGKLIAHRYIIPGWVPMTLRERGELEFQKQFLGTYIKNGEAQWDSYYEGLKANFKRAQAGAKEFQRAEVHKPDWRNKTQILDRLYKDFNFFSASLNTSKIITKPAPVGTVEEFTKAMEKMSNEDLLSVYDDVMYSQNEFVANKDMEALTWKNRDDLSPGANMRLKQWYQYNKDMINKRFLDNPTRILIALEAFKELEHRRVPSGDFKVRW